MSKAEAHEQTLERALQNDRATWPVLTRENPCKSPFLERAAEFRSIAALARYLAANAAEAEAEELERQHRGTCSDARCQQSEPPPGRAHRRTRAAVLPPPGEAEGRRPTPPAVAGALAYVFVFDTETTTDHAQQLTFGSYRFLERCPDGGPFVYACIEEGLFHANDPPGDVRERLLAYASAHGADVVPGGHGELRVLSLHEFVQRFYMAARKARALVAGFNLPFDLSRIACGVGEGRKGAFGGFSLPIVTHRTPDGTLVLNTYRAPGSTVKSIDSKRSLKKQWTYGDDDPNARIAEPGSGHAGRNSYYRGDFLELRTLAFALTDRGHTLDSACEAFGVERKGDPDRHPGWAFDDTYIDYNRRDTRITAALLFAMLREYAHHPIAGRAGRRVLARVDRKRLPRRHGRLAAAEALLRLFEGAPRLRNEHRPT